MDKSGHCELENSLLIAMPALDGTEFSRSVILLCAHSDDGAMGFMINKLENIQFNQFIESIKQSATKAPDLFPQTISRSVTIYNGGPVDKNRGFVIHSADFKNETTFDVSPNIRVTSTLDILSEIASGNGPKHATIMLGYSGWSAGQLENEIVENSWLTCALDENLLFDSEPDTIYTKALKSMGIEPAMLSGASGHA